jgi:Flp pilus assembly pilin Flp
MPREIGQMKTTSLKHLIRDEAGFYATEATIALTLVTLVAAAGTVVFGGSVAEFLVATGEDVKATADLMPFFGRNPLTN